MTVTLSDLLNDGKVHVLDGAMGTMLYSKGFLLNVCYDELNLKHPKLVQEVHEAYVRAGAEILETNTFGANPLVYLLRSEEHTSELQSRLHLVCRLLLEKKKQIQHGIAVAT